MRKKNLSLFLCTFFFISIFFLILHIESVPIGNLQADNHNNLNERDYILKNSFVNKIETDWEVSWGGSGGDYAYDLAVDNASNAYVTGFTTSFGGIYEAFLLKYNSSGALEWDCLWGGANEDISWSVAVDSEQNPYIAGYTRSFGGSDMDPFLVKYNPNGIQQWNVTFGGSTHDDALAIAIDDEDNIIVTGETESFGAGDDDIFLSKFYPNGTQMWFETWGTTAREETVDIGVDSQNQIYIAGYEDTYYPRVLKYDEDGNLLDYLSFGYSDIYDIEVDNSDNIILSMEVRGFGSWDQGQDQVLAKYYNNFTSSWSRSWADYEVSYNGDEKYIISVDSQDNIYAGGRRYCLMKFNEDGNPIWNFTRNYAINGIGEREIEIEIDAFQNVYYTWLSDAPDAFDARLAKFNNSTHSVSFSKPSRFEKKKIYAIIVGVENYPGTEYDLQYPLNDVYDRMIVILRNSWNVPTDNIYMLVEGGATQDRIKSTFDEIRSKIKPQDELLFFFSGHGGISSGVSYICPHDSIPSNPSAYITSYELKSELDSTTSAKSYVIIDACNSGGFIDECAGDNRFIMTACRKNEYSYESYYTSGGVFSKFLSEARQYTSDLNSDGLISLEEQFSYTANETTKYMNGYGESQHPQLYDGVSGETFSYPLIENISYHLFGNRHVYELILHGSGQVFGFNTTLHLNSNETITRIVNSSSTGFGAFTVEFQLEENDTVDRIEVMVEIIGYNSITLFQTFYMTPIPPPPATSILGYDVLVLMSSIFVFSSLTILFKKKKVNKVLSVELKQ